MTKSEIALELTKITLERSKIYSSEATFKEVSESVKETYNMFIKELKIYDSGDAIPDSE